LDDHRHLPDDPGAVGVAVNPAGGRIEAVKMSFHLHSRVWRNARVWRWVLVLVFLLVAVRVALPFAVKAYVNRQLNEAHDYAGTIGGVDLRLWRGGYRIHQIQIFKRSGNIQSPLFSAPEVDLSMDWRELLHGAVGQVFLRQPQVNFVAGPTEDQTQTGDDESWGKILQSLFPFNLDRCEITNGEIHFRNQFSRPPVDIYFSQLSATGTNLNNAGHLKQKLPAGLAARATTVGGGRLDLELQMDLHQPAPAYEVDFTLTNVNLTALNDFLRAYGKFDVAGGTFALYTSVAADAGNYDGYFKVFFDHLGVFAWDKERKKDILEIFWQTIVGGVVTAFKNHPHDQLAAKIPISGSYTGSHIGIWTAIATVLQNAFIHALVPKIDQHATVEEVQKTEAGK
jgi:hypothetical protein